MKITLQHNDTKYTADLNSPIDISIPLIHEAKGPKCFYAPDVHIAPVVVGEWVGSTLAGAPVNFKNLSINPHGNGTHTECVGHISTEPICINEVLKQSIGLATLITVEPTLMKNGDQIINSEILKAKISNIDTPILIIRTSPNTNSKLTADYSGTNPAYFTPEALDFIVQKKIIHLLIDLPSVDREEDEGKLSSHKHFWEYPDKIDMKKTITEMIFVPNLVKDGLYLCDIQIINLSMDASPSRPQLYKIDQL